jgi:predicted nucleic acid-binding protein
MGLVIDTSALVQLDRSRVVAKDLPFSNELIVLPIIVWAEALIGVRLANSAERAATRRGLLELIRLLTSFEPFSPEAAEIYANLYNQLRNEGQKILKMTFK